MEKTMEKIVALAKGQRTLRQLCPNLPFLLGGHGTGEQTHLYAQGGEESGKGSLVLFSQNFRGSHHGSLFAVLHRQVCRCGSHHGLAAQPTMFMYKTSVKIMI